MFERFIEVESYTATAETLNEEFEKVLESPLNYGHVKRYLQKPVYIGKPTIETAALDSDAKGEIEEHTVEDPSLALVDRETFEQAAEIIDEISAKYNHDEETMDFDNTLDEFGLFPVANSSPAVKLVCEECGGELRKNGQRELDGSLKCHNYECKECGKQRKFPKQSEYRKMKAI